LTRQTDELAAFNAEKSELECALLDVGDWLVELANGGPDLMLNAHLKAAHEAQELADAPSLEEYADVLVCLVGVAITHGWFEADVAQAVQAKLAINKARRWAQKPDGAWQHVA
jgi:hypothetical protein